MPKSLLPDRDARGVLARLFAQHLRQRQRGKRESVGHDSQRLRRL
jgi:hypothetical protein